MYPRAMNTTLRTDEQTGATDPPSAAMGPACRPSLAHTIPGKPRKVGHRPLVPAGALVNPVTDPDLPDKLTRFVGNRIDVVAQVT